MSTQIPLSRTWQQQVLRALGTYGRAFIASALAVYMTGDHRWQSLVSAGIAATVPVLLRALNPNDDSYGLSTPTYTAGALEEPQP